MRESMGLPLKHRAWETESASSESRGPLQKKFRTSPRVDRPLAISQISARKQCYRCRGFGHIAAACPTPQNMRLNTPPVAAPFQSGRGKGGYGKGAMRARGFGKGQSAQWGPTLGKGNTQPAWRPQVPAAPASEGKTFVFNCF